eukprot:5604875-Amphidinium_carterae.2
MLDFREPVGLCWVFDVAMRGVLKVQGKAYEANQAYKALRVGHRQQEEGQRVRKQVPISREVAILTFGQNSER